MRMVSCFALVLFASSVLLGQSPAFEIADVHVSNPGPFAAMSGGVPRGGRYEVRNATMLDLIRTAYDVTDEKVVGGPSWLSTDRFDVIAKTTPAATRETARLMLRALLADRFGLSVHNDSRPLPVYVLSRGKGAHKLRPTDGSASGCQPKQQAPPQPGQIQYTEGTCHNLTSAAIAEILRQVAGGYLDRPVVDSTNLEGAWDFDLKWTPRPQLPAAGADGITIFDAVDKQLGLKLDLQQMAMNVVVVDSVNRKPTDNLPGVAQSLPPEKPEFETSEVKPSPPGTQGVNIRYTQGGRIDAMGSLRDLIAISNEVRPNLAADFVVGPKFLETSHFTIVAKAPSTGLGAPGREGGREVAPPISVGLMMLRSMLEDRFKLQTHKEDRPVTVYALVAKAETKLKKGNASDRSECRQDLAAVPASMTVPTQAMTCQNTTMEELAKNLPQWASAYFDHAVIDTSGLQGGWNFTLVWSQRSAIESRPNTQPGGVAAAPDPGGISIFEAIEKLGLKLEKGAHPVPVIVVDHAEEKPID